MLLNGMEVRIGPFILTYLAPEQPTESKNDPVPDQKPASPDAPPETTGSSAVSAEPPASPAEKELAEKESAEKDLLEKELAERGTVEIPAYPSLPIVPDLFHMIETRSMELPTNGSKPARPLVLSR